MTHDELVKKFHAETQEAMRLQHEREVFAKLLQEECTRAAQQQFSALHRQQATQSRAYTMDYANLGLGGLGGASANQDGVFWTGARDYYYCSTAHSGFSGFGLTPEESKEEIKEHKKAENKAILLMQNMIGIEQCDAYRKTHRVIVRPGKFFWVIGDIKNSFYPEYPFRGKPYVMRIDNPDKLHVTSFCVVQANAEPTPYTDKVIAFASHLISDEKEFVKTVNRIKEDTLEKMFECATWGI